MSSAPRIVCRAGPSLSQLEPVPVNSSSIHIESSLFEGNVFVRLKDYKGPVGEDGKSQPEQAFSGEKDTWSIAFEGKFKRGKEEDGLEVDEIVRVYSLGSVSVSLTNELKIRLTVVWKYLGETN